MDDPLLVARFDIMTGETARLGKIVNHTAIDHGRGSRTTSVELGSELLVVGLFPEDFPIAGIEAPQGIAVTAVAHCKGTTIGYGKARASFSNIGFPKGLGTFLLDFFRDDPFGGPVAVRSEVRGPVRTAGDASSEDEGQDLFHGHPIVPSGSTAKSRGFASPIGKGKAQIVWKA